VEGLLHFSTASGNGRLSQCAVFNGSGPFLKRDQEIAERLLAGWSIQCNICPRSRCHPELTHLSGTDPERLDDLHWALSTEQCDFAWSSRGGFGLARLLPILEYGRLNPRPVLGFSDVTALQWALYRRGWTNCIHIPNLHSVALFDHQPSRKAIRDMLMGASAKPWHLRSWVPGQFSGPMVGGNLNVLAGLCGTDDQFVGADRVVFLEEVNEVPYRLDHNLTQMLRCGCFAGARAIVLGQFVDCSNPRLIEAILRDRLGGLGVPVVAKAPIGHGRVFRPFRQGDQVQFQIDS
jgi:muramoyltetrapeptide carboxypeptidase